MMYRVVREIDVEAGGPESALHEAHAIQAGNADEGVWAVYEISDDGLVGGQPISTIDGYGESARDVAEHLAYLREMDYLRGRARSTDE
jgi:hypothetical protein